MKQRMIAFWSRLQQLWAIPIDLALLSSQLYNLREEQKTASARDQQKLIILARIEQKLSQRAVSASVPAEDWDTVQQRALQEFDETTLRR